nr:MAG TPA: holin [Caudoviricetes sp.]
MNYTELISQILLIVSVLTALVNIVTEVAKKTFDWVQGSKVINVFVLALSLILTVGVFTAYWQIKQMELAWYVIAAFIIVGFLVAYAAMFGYDKLLSYLKKEG